MLVSRRLLLMVVLAVVGTLGVAAHWAMAEEAAEPEQDVVAEEPVAEEPAESDNPFGAFGEGADESSDPFGADGHESNPFGGEMEGTDPFGGGGEFGGRGGGLGRPMGGEFGGRGGVEFGGEMGGARGGGFGGGEFSSGPQAEQPSGAARKKAFQFPTAEEQLYADRAFHLLAIEVEKLSPEEVERVEKLGLQGGVRIASTAGPNDATRASWLREGDILVGLKTSPITGLKDLFDFLGRDDLGESQPMKMYVVRRTQKPSDDSFGAGGGEFGGRGAGFGGNGPGEFGGRGGGTAFTDEVVNGRISPDMNAWTATQKPPSVPQGEKVEIDANGRIKVTGFKKSATPPGSPITLYDGKTFDEWHGLWRNELKPERRTEAVRAMAAFARVGKAKEATEAILDAAQEYDFSKTVSGSPTFALMSQIADVLRQGDATGGIPPEIAWPAVLGRYRSDPEKYTHLLVAVMRLIKTSPTFRDDLLELSKSENLYVREKALTRLMAAYGDDPEGQASLVAELQSGDGERIKIALNALGNSGGWTTEADSLLTADDPQMQLAARRLVANLNQQNWGERGLEQGQQLAERVLKRISNTDDADDKIALIRAIACLRKVASHEALERVQDLKDDKDDRVAIAAVVAERALRAPTNSQSRKYFEPPTEWAKARGVEELRVINGQRSRTPEWQTLDEAVKDEAFATFGIE